MADLIDGATVDRIVEEANGYLNEHTLERKAGLLGYSVDQYDDRVVVVLKRLIWDNEREVDAFITLNGMDPASGVRNVAVYERDGSQRVRLY